MRCPTEKAYANDDEIRGNAVSLQKPEELPQRPFREMAHRAVLPPSTALDTHTRTA